MEIDTWNTPGEGYINNHTLAIYPFATFVSTRVTARARPLWAPWRFGRTQPYGGSVEPSKIGFKLNFGGMVPLWALVTYMHSNPTVDVISFGLWFMWPLVCLCGEL